MSLRESDAAKRAGKRKSTAVALAPAKPKRRRGRPNGEVPRKRFELPDGDLLLPREEFLSEVLGLGPHARLKYKLPSFSIGGVCYVSKNAALNAIAGLARHAPEVTTSVAKGAPRQSMPKLTAVEQRKLIALIESQPVQGQRGRPRRKGGER